MEILGIDLLGPLKWLGVMIGGVAIGRFVFNKLMSMSQTLVDKFGKKITAEINKIEDEHLEMIARQAVRYIASKMPDASNMNKLQEAINYAKALTPDIVLSDDKVELVIESAYMDLKRELAKV